MASEFLSISMLQLAIATAICVFSVILKTLCYREASPLRSLPGPRSSHILWGNEKELFFSAPGFIYRHWKKQHGSIFKFSGAFGRQFLCICDPVSIQHILGPARFPYFPKPVGARTWFRTVGGPGLLFVEDRAEHRALRKLISPSLSPTRLDAFVPRFCGLANKVATLIDDQIVHRTELDFAWWSTRYALDAICHVGFDHDLDAFSEGAPLPKAFDDLNHSERNKLSFVMKALFWLFPIIMKMPSEKGKRIQEVRRQLDLAASRIRESHSASGVLSLITDDNEADTDFVETQIRTLISAAYETVSATLSWIVYEIARDQLLQQRLREELGKLQGCPEESSVRQLPLLDAVFNETLRMHPPVSVLHHVAAQTVIVPTSTSQIVVPGGTVIAIPVDAVHRDEAVWGGDCNEFWPERWLGKSQRSEALLSFSQGTRVCMGRVFAEMEIKILVIELLRRFEVEVVKPVAPYQAFAVRPMAVAGSSELELPLVFTRICT